jgi:hypothetical protein
VDRPPKLATGFEAIHHMVSQDVKFKAVDKSEQPAVFF